MNKATNTRTSTKAVRKPQKATPQQEHDQREVKLIKAAVSVKGDTKKAIIAALPAGGLAGNPANVERVQEFRDDFDAARRHRRLNLANARAAKAISALPSSFQDARQSDCLLGRLQCA